MNRPRRAAMRTAHVPEGRGARDAARAGSRPRPEPAASARAMAGLGDPPAALGLARAPLAGHEAEVGLDLMRVREALGVVDRGDEGGGGDRPDAGDGVQARHAVVRTRDVRDPLVGVRELLVELAHDGEQRRDLREQAARQGQGEDAVDEALRTAGRHALAVLAEQGADDADVARARADQGVADRQAAAHMALGIGEPMGGAVGPEQAGLGQRPGIAPVGLDLAACGSRTSARSSGRRR